MPNPLVSVCICQLGRPASLARCLNSIAANTQDYPDYGVILEWDRWENRQGCPRTLAKAVARARGEYIAFSGNDCVARPGWLRIAMEHMAVDFPDPERPVTMTTCAFSIGEFRLPGRGRPSGRSFTIRPSATGAISRAQPDRDGP